MLKELFDDRVRAGIARVEMQELPELSSNEQIDLKFRDTFRFTKSPQILRVEFTREVKFEPQCNFEIKVTYFVEHVLKEPGALDAIPDEELENEVSENIGFYIQDNLGFVARVSLLIAQLTTSFGGAPIILPPNHQITA